MGKKEPFTLYKRPGCTNWSYSFTIHGRGRIRRSTRSPEKEKAREKAWAAYRKETQRLSNAETLALTFWEAALMYQDSGKDTPLIDPLMQHFGQKLISEIGDGDIREAAPILYPGRSPATWNRHVIVPARAIINAAAAKKLCSYIRVKLYKEQPPVRRAADDSWLNAFMNKAEPEIAALALLMASTGARIGQALAIKWGGVHFPKGEITIPAAKGYPERIAFMTPALVAALANLRPEKAGDDTPIFRFKRRWSIYKPWRKACADAGIAYIPTHQAGRHTFFTEMIVRNRIDPKTAATLGGSASPSLLLKVYSHPEKGDAVIREVFGTFGAQRRKIGS